MPGFDLPFEIKTDIIVQQVENETLLLNPDTGDIFGLDAVSTRTWELMQSYDNMSGVKLQMLQDFDVEETILETDLENFFNQLVDLGIISSK